MSQFDLETSAALGQLKFEELSKTPGGEFVEIIGDLVALIGTGGLWAVAGGTSNLLLKVRKLAGASYASNLIYVITAVRNDLADLYEREERLRKRIETLPDNPQFAEAISGLALRAMQTSVKNRLKRLARIVVNGVKENDLEPEGLDDIMRAAVELKESDILFLGKIYDAQNLSLSDKNLSDTARLEQMQTQWPNQLPAPVSRETILSQHRGSVARLQTHAFVQFRTPGFGTGGELTFLLEDGARFYERLQRIS